MFTMHAMRGNPAASIEIYVVHEVTICVCVEGKQEGRGRGGGGVS